MKKGPHGPFFLAALERASRVALHHLGDGLAHVVDVFAVQSSHTHATCVGAVHTEFRAQTHHLVFAQT